MGQAGWLVRELRAMETICWGDSVEHYITYEEEP